MSGEETPAFTRPLEGLLVLVVEDHEDSRTLYATVLSLNGANVVAVGSVREAIEAFEKSRFDVLVSDVNMPEEDGYDLIATLRARPEDEGGLIPAIAVTALDGDEDQERLHEAGFQYFLGKPVEAARLVEAIAKAAGR